MSICRRLRPFCWRQLRARNIRASKTPVPPHSPLVFGRNRCRGPEQHLDHTLLLPPRLASVSRDRGILRRASRACHSRSPADATAAVQVGWWLHGCNRGHATGCGSRQQNQRCTWGLRIHVRVAGSNQPRRRRQEPYRRSTRRCGERKFDVYRYRDDSRHRDNCASYSHAAQALMQRRCACANISGA